MSSDKLTEKPRSFLSRMLIRYLTGSTRRYLAYSVTPSAALKATMRPGDVLLVEGNQRFSTAVKYLTQSTWSHAAFFVGNYSPDSEESGEPLGLVEANLEHGVIAVSVSKYEGLNTRICRPVGLSEVDRIKAAQFMIDRIGYQYDLKNVMDLARYLLPTPPVPSHWRRRMLALGSGDPTRVICSTLIAQAFQAVQYPILPEVKLIPVDKQHMVNYTTKEVLHIRNYTLFAPRDFDLSPYFSIIKPAIVKGFDYKKLEWAEDSS